MVLKQKKKIFFFGKIFFSFDFRMIFFGKRDPKKLTFGPKTTLFGGLFFEKKSFENRRKKIFSQKKKKFFFLLQNRFKIILKPFWGSKKSFDFFFRFSWMFFEEEIVSLMSIQSWGGFQMTILFFLHQFLGSC